MKRASWVVLVSICLGGCVAPPTPQEQTVLSRRLLCMSAEECSVMWKRAQLWVAQNSRYKIQSATDVVITTYGPIGVDAYFAHQVLREPVIKETEQIKLVLRCPNLFGCGSRAEETARFQAYVEGR
jgi:hypothetical protein